MGGTTSLERDSQCDGREPSGSLAMDDLIEFVTQYALFGFADWNERLDGLRRSKALRNLQSSIVESEEEVRSLISDLQTTNPSKIIPIPQCGHIGIERCFFVPRKVDGICSWTLAFDLVLLVHGNLLLAFRFEPADGPSRAHSYPHIQPCRRVAQGRIPLDGVPGGMPEKYPAFPLPSSKPQDLFLSMLVSVHGHAGATEAVVREAFQRASRSRRATPFVNALHSLLGTVGDPKATGPK